MHESEFKKIIFQANDLPSRIVFTLPLLWEIRPRGRHTLDQTSWSDSNLKPPRSRAQSQRPELSNFAHQ